MKTRIAIILLFLSISAAFAIKLQWDSNPDTNKVLYYTVYNGTTAIATVTPTPTVSPAPSPNVQSFVLPSPVPLGIQTYQVSATNVRGEDGKSVAVTIPADVPAQVQNVVTLP